MPRPDRFSSKAVTPSRASRCRTVLTSHWPIVGYCRSRAFRRTSIPRRGDDENCRRRASGLCSRTNRQARMNRGVAWEVGIRILRTRLSNSMMANDFWQQVFAKPQVPVERPSAQVSTSLPESTSVLARLWQRSGRQSGFNVLACLSDARAVRACDEHVHLVGHYGASRVFPDAFYMCQFMRRPPRSTGFTAPGSLPAFPRRARGRCRRPFGAPLQPDRALW
jgi:hypothetical protein